VSDALEFFHEKKPWSRYKDLILDYYLEPYLAKVAQLGRPILVVDCFAGPGQFDDGARGSPLIISRRLQSTHERGVQVQGFYIEKDPTLYERLSLNVQGLSVPVQVRQGDFKQYIAEISELARDRTVFIYLDPIRPSDLLLEDLESVYNQLKHGRSIEVLINFMSTGFLRAVCGLASQILVDNVLQPEHPLVRHWNAVAGGTYWQEVVFGGQVSDPECVEQLAQGYADRLHQWFKWVIRYPIRENYKDRPPKYHLTFGSRHLDAIDLMNRAMVKARREFVGACFVDGFLFANQPQKEIIDPCEIENAVVVTSQTIGKAKWKELRVRATIANPCTCTDSECDSAIKRAIQKGSLASNCSGERIDNNAWIWSPQQR
jgi:three-Cys-motif partner protein